MLQGLDQSSKIEEPKMAHRKDSNAKQSKEVRKILKMVYTDPARQSFNST